MMKQLIACCGLDCEIHKCVSEKGINTCGDCKELDNCQIVGAVFQHAPGAKKICSLRQLSERN